MDATACLNSASAKQWHAAAVRRAASAAATAAFVVPAAAAAALARTAATLEPPSPPLLGRFERPSMFFATSKPTTSSQVGIPRKPALAGRSGWSSSPSSKSSSCGSLRLRRNESSSRGVTGRDRSASATTASSADSSTGVSAAAVFGSSPGRLLFPRRDTAMFRMAFARFGWRRLDVFGADLFGGHNGGNGGRFVGGGRGFRRGTFGLVGRRRLARFSLFRLPARATPPMPLSRVLFRRLHRLSSGRRRGGHRLRRFEQIERLLEIETFIEEIRRFLGGLRWRNVPPVRFGRGRQLSGRRRRRCDGVPRRRDRLGWGRWT